MYIVYCRYQERQDSKMENNNYLKPNEILKECLFGIGKIKDETKRESEEILDISSDDENDEESFNKEQKSCGGLNRRNEDEIIEISSGEENEEEKESLSKVKEEDGG